MTKHLGEMFRVQGINVGISPSDPDRFSNRKAELYWGLRMRFEEGQMAGLTDEKTIAQLAGMRYRHNARGQVVTESKDEARKRGVRSPDRAEALMLAFAPEYSYTEEVDTYEQDRVRISPFDHPCRGDQ